MSIPYGTGRVAFIAKQAEIATMLAAGHTKKNIYNHMKEHLAGLSYPQFTRYIRSRIQNISAPPKANIEQSKPKEAVKSFVPGDKDPNLDDLF